LVRGGPGVSGGEASQIGSLRDTFPSSTPKPKRDAKGIEKGAQKEN